MGNTYSRDNTYILRQGEYIKWGEVKQLEEEEDIQKL